MPLLLLIKIQNNIKYTYILAIHESQYNTNTIDDTQKQIKYKWITHKNKVAMVSWSFRLYNSICSEWIPHHTFVEYLHMYTTWVHIYNICVTYENIYTRSIVILLFFSLHLFFFSYYTQFYFCDPLWRLNCCVVWNQYDYIIFKLMLCPLFKVFAN